MSAREMTGEGNIQSTIEDLARWDGNFYDPKVGGKAWLETMRTPGKLDDGTPLTYAMGLAITKSGSGLPLEQHSGGWAGYLSDGRRLPTKRLAVTVLCNRDDSDPIALTSAVFAALVPESSVEPVPPGAPPPPAPSSGDGAAPAPDVSMFVGSYIDRESLLVRSFIAKDGALQMAGGIGPDFRPPPRHMDRVGPRSFHIPGAPSTWTFEAAKGTEPPHVTRVASTERTQTYARFEPQPFDVAKAAAYVGRYESPEMMHDFEVAIVDGKLVAGPWGKSHMAEKLSPLDRDVFEAPWFGLVFGRNAKGAVASIVTVFAGYRAVRWTKRAGPGI
jgi:hypothetical protein